MSKLNSIKNREAFYEFFEDIKLDCEDYCYHHDDQLKLTVYDRWIETLLNLAKEAYDD